MLKSAGAHPWLAIPLTAFFGLSLGLMNGVFIAYLRLNPFVVTLASGAIFAGMTLVINVSGYWERVVVGAIVLIAVLTDLFATRN